MPNPPKYDITQLNDQTQFLCERGAKLTVPRLDIDNQPKNPPLESYYCIDDTNVPIEVLNTGNIKVLSSYLTEHGNELNDEERQHLNERINVMQHFADLEKHYQDNPRTSVGKMVEQNGKKVLPGIVLDREQDTGNGCWSCAFSMLLKGRGVDVDQKLIRRYRPEFVRGHEIISPEQTDIINSNMMSEIYQYSSLIDKICPNTKMCKMDRAGQTGATKEAMKTEVLKALREKNAPVAFCNGTHWTTIVGVSDDNSTFYVVNSQNTVGGKIDTVDVNDYLDHSNAEFVWLEDIVLDKDGRSNSLPNDRFRVDKDSGSVMLSLQGNAEKGDSGMSIHGNHVVDYENHMEIYVPTMIRDYSKSYIEQKTQSKKFLDSNGVDADPVPEDKPFTSVSNNSYENVKSRLRRQVEKNSCTERKCRMRDEKLFTQSQIDGMTEAEANRSYTYYLSHPGIKSIPQEIVSGQSPDAKDDFSAFDWDSIPEEYLAPQRSDWAFDNSFLGKNIDLDSSLLYDLLGDQDFDQVQNLYAQNQGTKTTSFNKKDFGNAMSDKDFDALSPEEIEALFQTDTAQKLKSKQPESQKITVPLQTKVKLEKNIIPETKTVPETKVITKQQENIHINVKNDPAENLAQEAKNFAALGQKLEKAKTVVNSKQYNDLVKMIKTLGDEKTAKSSKELRTALMATAAATVNDYIAHKAKDGVKPNVFRKLAAVEEVSKYLSTRLAPHQGKTITVGKEKITVDVRPLSLNARYHAAHNSAKTTFDQTIGRNPVEEKLKAIQDTKLRNTAENANECMNKILLQSAVSSRHNLQELDAMRIRFADEKLIRNELTAGKEKTPEAETTSGIHI